MAHPPGQPLVLPGQEEGLKAGERGRISAVSTLHLTLWMCCSQTSKKGVTLYLCDICYVCSYVTSAMFVHNTVAYLFSSSQKPTAHNEYRLAQLTFGCHAHATQAAHSENGSMPIFHGTIV